MNAPVTEALLESLILELAPFFLGAVGGNQTAALKAADEMISRAMPCSDAEMMMVVQTFILCRQSVAASIAALNPNLPEKERLRFHQVTSRLTRDSTRLHMLLDKRRTARRAAAADAAAQPRPEPARQAHMPAPPRPEPAPRAATPEHDRDAAARIAAMLRDRAEAIIGAPPPDDIDRLWREEHGPAAGATTLPGLPPGGKPKPAQPQAPARR